MQAPQLILASGSPRRRQLLQEAGYTFVVEPSDIDENQASPELAPGELAEHLAVEKARAVAGRFPKAVVLGADTVVAFADHVLGKPRDAADAERMLRLLSNTVHSVITGVAVVHVSRTFFVHTRILSAVHMRALSDAEIDRYVASLDWQGKAGGYGIQDPDPFVTRISGCHTNIVGLPMHTTADLLAQAGVQPSLPKL